MRAALTLVNGDRVFKRIDSFVASMLTGIGSRKIAAVAKSTVIEEYRMAFGRGGFPGDKPWRSTKGIVTLVLIEQFAKSFDNPEIVVIGNTTKLTIKMANAYTHPRMNDDYIACLRRGIQLVKETESSEGQSIELRVSGPAGGISKSGANKLFREMRVVTEFEANRVWHGVR